jgi:ABC-2 type transport system permease protein
MNDILTLLQPRWISLKNGGRSNAKGGRVAKLLILAAIGLLFWAGLFAGAMRVLLYFKGIPDIGDILNDKLLSMILITAFALLIFSSILTALSKLYLSRDLFLVHSMPVESHKIFIARWIDSTIDSSWMVVLYTLPVFIAYGVVYDSGVLYYGDIILAIVSLATIASGIGAFFVILAVLVFPASRMKNLFIFLSILFFVILYLSIRLLKPEVLVDPEVFDTVVVYITSLQTPASPFLPTTWIFDSMTAARNGALATSLFHIGLALSFAAVVVCGLVAVADRIYYGGFSKAQTAHVRMIKNSGAIDRLTGFLPGPIRAHTQKEIKSFFRDQSQWTQLFLIGALIIIYVYNFKVLPLEKSPIKTVYLQNLLSFLNMGLALFVLTAVAGRFAYPAVSTEKEAFWLIKTSPSSIRSFLWIKFFIYYFPLLVLTEILIFATNILLKVTPFMMVLSTVTVFFMVPGVVAMGIGFGAAFPDFKAESPAQAITSFGGLLFMILCAGMIAAVIVLEAGPVYRIFMTDFWGRSLRAVEWLWITGSFVVVLCISITAVIWPMRFGEKKLSEHPI